MAKTVKKSDNTVKLSGAAVPQPSNGIRVGSIERNTQNINLIFKRDEKISLLEYMLFKEDRNPKDGKTNVSAAPSAQGVTIGRKPHPFNMKAVAEFQTSNEHHSACINTKKNATVGLGFRHKEELDPNVPLGMNTIFPAGSKAQDALAKADATKPNRKPSPQQPNGPAGATAGPAPVAFNPTAALVRRQQPTKADLLLNKLCTGTFINNMLIVGEDFHQVGQGYLEIVRARGEGSITGIHTIPPHDVFIYIEDANYNWHYEVFGEEGMAGSRHFPRWGDTEGFLKRNAGNLNSWYNTNKVDAGMVSEIICFKQPSSRSRWYGFPNWLACVSSIELVQCMTQFKYDFFLNRGVPEFMFFLLGQKLAEADWLKIENALKGNIGLGNSHKTVALNLENPDLKIELEKLAMEGGSDSGEFAATKENLALGIVSAHQVPPLLAGIQIPGKLGANNELPNALMAFQTLVIGPNQRNIQQTLAMTLGNKEENGGLDLDSDDFLFRTITEEIDVGTLETQSRMRESVVTALAGGRDITAGVKQ